MAENMIKQTANAVTVRHPSRGFTLIELIIVISIIGILAAVALPRLIDAQRDARIAKTNAIFGLIRSASALAHSRCVLDLASVAPSLTLSNCTTSPPMVNMDGIMVRIVNQYPAATADGIDTAAALNAVADGIVVGGGGTGAPVRTYDMAGGTVPNCRVTYQEATLSGSIIVSPVITVITTGC